MQIISGPSATCQSASFSWVQDTSEGKGKLEGRRQDREEGKSSKTDRTKKKERQRDQRRQKERRQDGENSSKTMETVKALHAYFYLLLACGVLSLTVSASVHPGAREDVMGQYRLTNRQQCHRLCWYRALCGSYSYHTESSAPLMDMSTSPPNCVLHAQNDSENGLCSACLRSVYLCCLCSAQTTCPCFTLSAFCLHPPTRPLYWPTPSLPAAPPPLTPRPLYWPTPHFLLNPPPPYLSPVVLAQPLPSYCTLHPTRAAVHLPHHLFQLLLFHWSHFE